MLIRIFLLTVLYYITVDTRRKKIDTRPLKVIQDVLEIVPERPKGAVYFFHGVGDSGGGMKRWLDSLMGRVELFSGMHVVFPTAPKIKYSTIGDAMYNAWFNEKKYVIRGKEDLATIHDIALDVVNLIKNESHYHIPTSNVFLGGFGMGGNIAMHIAYRYAPEVGGVFGLSSFLKRHSNVFRAIRMQRKERPSCVLPEMFMIMGEDDKECLPEWTIKTYKKLMRLGVAGRLYTMPNVRHELRRKELMELEKWINSKTGEIEVKSIDYEYQYAEPLKFNVMEEFFVKLNMTVKPFTFRTRKYNETLGLKFNETEILKSRELNETERLQEVYETQKKIMKFLKIETDDD